MIAVRLRPHGGMDWFSRNDPIRIFLLAAMSTLAFFSGRRKPPSFSAMAPSRSYYGYDEPWRSSMGLLGRSFGSGSATSFTLPGSLSPAASLAAATPAPATTSPHRSPTSDSQTDRLKATGDTLTDISAKFNRDAIIRIGSLVLTFNEAEQGYVLNTVRGIEKDGVR